jgi:DNA-binding MarR family transcriptional regulator
MTDQMIKRELVLALQVLQRREDFRRLRMVKPLRQSEHGMGGMRGVLEYLSQQDAPVLNVDIAEEFDVKPSSVTMLMNKAEGNGFITRTDDANDRRRKRISITEEGLKFIGGRRQNQDKIVDGLFVNFTEDELLDLLHLVNKMNATPDVKVERPTSTMESPRPGQERTMGLGRPRSFDRVAAEEEQVGRFAQQVAERSERYGLRNMAGKIVPYEEMTDAQKAFVQLELKQAFAGSSDERTVDIAKRYGIPHGEYHRLKDMFQNQDIDLRRQVPTRRHNFKDSDAYRNRTGRPVGRNPRPFPKDERD